MKDLNEFGVQEMNLSELKRENGGHPILAAIAIIGAGIYVYNNWDDFCEGVSDGYNNY